MNLISIYHSSLLAVSLFIPVSLAKAQTASTPAGNWFLFQPGIAASSTAQSRTDELSMSAWLDAPAGKHGRLKSRGDTFVFSDTHNRVKFWGINVNYGSCAPSKEDAVRRADFYARNGINLVRLHKYADGPRLIGIQELNTFQKFDPAALDRMDFFVAQLKARGIYIVLSPTFGVNLGRDDEAAVPYMRELGEFLGEEELIGKRIYTKRGTIYLSRELQDLQIGQTICLLTHKNPYTGLTYASDPAVAIVELYNEDSALYSGRSQKLMPGLAEKMRLSPTLRQRAALSFTTWLKTRYTTPSELLKAWGPNAINAFAQEGFDGESVTGNDGRDSMWLVPAGHPDWFDPAQITEGGARFGQRQRLLDTMLFLYELQNKFYDRFLAALRQAGYEGEVVSSNWMAGRGFSHYFNLHSDARIGVLDRHNYFSGWKNSMLDKPGSGLLGLGLQQVHDRPFMISEWAHIFPNQFGVEGPVLLGAYGLGLQGWDASCIFSEGIPGDFPGVLGKYLHDMMVPEVVGIFPFVARQVLRGDVRESPRIVSRYVNIEGLHAGRLGFDDWSRTDGDVKEYGGHTVPPASLAVARCVVEFTPTFRATPSFDPAGEGGMDCDNILSSSTGELRWKAGDTSSRGWVTINTAGTQAVVGFTQGRRFELDDVCIETISPDFSAIYVTARDPDETIATANSIIVCTLARSRNADISEDEKPLLLQKRPDKGANAGPVLVEPVKATLTFKHQPTGTGMTVRILDHDGRDTGRVIPVGSGSDMKILLDGGTTQTFYYLISRNRNPANIQ
ncbi:MAG: hypothetical protein LBK99_09915 [Opitutaceae bacterium]|jgi:hypothetical protein|nr:hypothetical protein [Opitutaceae bacterium]